MNRPSNFFAKINVRLTLIITAMAAGASLLVFGLLLFSLDRGFRNQDREDLNQRLISYWSAWHYGGNQSVLEQAMEDIKEYGDKPFLFILEDSDGRVLGSVVPGGWEDYNLDDLSINMLHPGVFTTIQSSETRYNLLVTGMNLNDGSRLLVGMSTETRERLLAVYRKYYPITFVGIILAGILVGFLASRSFLAPIIRLNGEIDYIIATGELGRRLETGNNGGQFNELIGRYNKLLDRAESLIGGMRDTLDSVAHDLRTPLTRMRGHAELALRNGDKTVCEEALAKVVEQTDQAGALLSAMMEIAEAEQGMLILSLEECDLSVLSSEMVDMYSLVAEENGQTLTLNASEPVLVQGDSIRLRRIIGNIIDNAVKYGGKNSRIDVNCGHKENYGWLEVIDDGPGVSEEESLRIFEKHYRGDKSRFSRGLGLGLSMVKALVDAHNGEIQVEKISGRGAKFRILFPILSKK